MPNHSLPEHTPTASRRLLLIAAMGAEEEAILKILGTGETFAMSETLKLTGRRFRKGTHELLLIQSGIGLVNAGVATALTLDKYFVDGIILFGVAGALVPTLDVGELVLATRIIQHDSIFSGETGDLPMAPGYPYVSLPPDDRVSPVFESDSTFREWVEKHVLAKRNIHYAAGVLASGSEFVGTPARKMRLGKHEQSPIAVEMESAGIAVVASRANVPFLVLKTVADRLNPDETVTTDFNTFLEKAAANAGAVVQEIWDAWSRSAT